MARLTKFHRQQVPLPILNKYASNNELDRALMFWVKWMRRTLCHMYDRSKVASVICALVPRATTGRTCLKAPPNNMTSPHPKKGNGQSIISCNDLSSISTHYRLVIATSSPIIRDALLSSLVVPLCFEKPCKWVSSILIGILNLECVVRPLGMMDATILDVVVAIDIRTKDRTFARKTLYRYVFPVPPGLSTKKTRPLPLMTWCNISLKATLCSTLVYQLPSVPPDNQDSTLLSILHSDPLYAFHLHKPLN
jgi:hypothetical protein